MSLPSESTSDDVKSPLLLPKRAARLRASLTAECVIRRGREDQLLEAEGARERSSASARGPVAPRQAGGAFRKNMPVISNFARRPLVITTAIRGCSRAGCGSQSAAAE